MFSENIRPVWAEIDLDKLANNMREIKRVCVNKEVIGVIKADGYGHGAIDIYKELQDNGASRFAVAVLSEGIELRKAGLDAPLMILGFTNPNIYNQLLDYDIEQTIYSFQQAEILSRVAVEKNLKARIHIKVDTGMGRIGFLPTREDAKEVYRISKLPNIDIVGLFTHFSSSDEKNKEYTYRQLEQYNKFNVYLKELGIHINFKHVSNSGAIIDLPELQYDAVRAGIILYGYYPSEQINKQALKLEPVMSIKANIVHIKKISEGNFISYGRKFETQKESIIATLSIGYADGFTRLLFEKAKVIIKGKFAPVVGRICMDQCMIDITGIENVDIGDEVILIGKDEFGNEITADDIGNLIGTINYEVVCAISKRVPRKRK